MGRPDLDMRQLPDTFAGVEVPTSGLEGLIRKDVQALDDLALRSMHEVASLLAAVGKKPVSQESTTSVDFDLDRANDDAMNLGSDLVSTSNQEEGEK